jgi:hypothetical protein
MSVEHNILGGTANQHAVYRWTAATQTDRYALSVTSADKGKIAYQTDKNSFWILVDDTQSANSKGWVKTERGPYFVQEISIASGAGPNTGTVDIPIADDGFTFINIHAVGVNQSNGKCVVVEDWVAVRRTAGTLDYPVGSFLAQVAPEVGSGWDTTWYARGQSSSNIRLTLKGDTSNQVKWRVEADWRAMPFPA